MQRIWTLDKHALITGASSGIGRELALNLMGVCRKLTLISRNSEGQLDELRKKLITINSDQERKTIIETITVNILDLNRTNELIHKIYDEDQDQVDIFINCAGGSHIFNLLENMSFR